METVLSKREGLASDEKRNGFGASLRRAVDWLKRDQRSDPTKPGSFWVGRLESNACMEAEWIFLQHVLGCEPDEKYHRVIKAIWQERREDGTWGVYFGAGGDINTTIEAYAALRVAGVPASDPRMVQTRDWILANGGLCAARNFTKYWLALLGEWPWRQLPILPPELILFPNWFPFSIYRFASWARGTMIPLCILSVRRVTRSLSEGSRLDELFPEGREAFDYSLKHRRGWFSFDGFFFAADRLLHAYQDFIPDPLKPMRETSIRLCIEWIIRHQEADGAWSGIQPPWIYSLMALHMEGYALSHPVVRAGLDAFNLHWRMDVGEVTFLQASESPVWDTALSCLALLDAGETLKTSCELKSASEWLLNEQVTSWGDWQQVVRNVKPAGWSFEFENDAYPDVDDTAVVLIVLQRLAGQLDFADSTQIRRAISSGLDWMIAMQCRNGGWAAFDRDNDTRLLTRIPFADFGELLDPPSVDVTAHVLEALAVAGFTCDDPVVSKALAFVVREQEMDGSWFGRWGVNHIYGTAAVLPALKALGLDMDELWIRRAGDWLVAHQNSDGGWGETPASYMDPSLRGVGRSTASQTAWALMGLVSFGNEIYGDSILRGCGFLAETQTAEGTWLEPEFTGTGFPGYGVGERIEVNEKTASELRQGTDLQRSFMINYHLYRHYFPVMALARVFHGTGPGICERSVAAAFSGET